MSIIKVNAIQHTSANDTNMTLFANGNVAITTANTTLRVGNTVISNAGVSVGGAAINPLYPGMRNRIINGDMRVDQRYGGAANTINTGVSVQPVLDRWTFNNNSGTGVFTVRQMDSSNTSASNYEANSAPAGFNNSMKLTVTTANTTTSSASYSGLYQGVEGLNIIDLDWGKPTAKPITVSFWVKSNITGQYSWAIFNQSSTRIYPSSVTINSANTWEYKSFTVPGETTGTWLVTNNTGFYFQLWPVLGSNYLTSSIGWNSSASFYGLTGQTNFMATVGNTFYITGLQIEAGSAATPFEWRPYGTELDLCQRYCQVYSFSGYQYIGVGQATSSTSQLTPFKLVKTMRASPTLGLATTAASTFGVGNSTNTTQAATAISINNVTTDFVALGVSVASGLTAGNASLLGANNTAAKLALEAEL